MGERGNQFVTQLLGSRWFLIQEQIISRQIIQGRNATVYPKTAAL